MSLPPQSNHGQMDEGTHAQSFGRVGGPAQGGVAGGVKQFERSLRERVRYSAPGLCALVLRLCDQHAGTTVAIREPSGAHGEVADPLKAHQATDGRTYLVGCHSRARRSASAIWCSEASCHSSG
jgi:hypothetical protein